LSAFLDLKKAFDIVDHTTVFLKLQKYGVESTSHNWFTSYMTISEQLCYFHGARSGRSILMCGIPQGLCLGIPHIKILMKHKLYL